MSAQGVGDSAKAEEKLTGALTDLRAVAENYPQLRATENFQQLSRNLSEPEDEIQASRRIYNSNVQSYNTAIQQFPGRLSPTRAASRRASTSKSKTAPIVNRWRSASTNSEAKFEHERHHRSRPFGSARAAALSMTQQLVTPTEEFLPEPPLRTSPGTGFALSAAPVRATFAHLSRARPRPKRPRC